MSICLHHNTADQPVATWLRIHRWVTMLQRTCSSSHDTLPALNTLTSWHEYLSSVWGIFFLRVSVCVCKQGNLILSIHVHSSRDDSAIKSKQRKQPVISPEGHFFKLWVTIFALNKFQINMGTIFQFSFWQNKIFFKLIRNPFFSFNRCRTDNNKCKRSLMVTTMITIMNIKLKCGVSVAPRWPWNLSKPTHGFIVSVYQSVNESCFRSDAYLQHVARAVHIQWLMKVPMWTHWV